MNTISVSSILEDLRKVKDYGAMADISHENISRLLSKQLRCLPLNKSRGGKNGGRRYICGG